MRGKLQKTSNFGRIWIEQEAYDREGLRRAHNLLGVKFRKRGNESFERIRQRKRTNRRCGRRLIYYYDSLDAEVQTRATTYKSFLPTEFAATYPPMESGSVFKSI